VSGHMPLSETAKQILWSASQEAERTGTKQIMPRHLASAIVNQGQTLAADLLRRHGINLDRLRTE
jgi:ATP-dependent Clp protease ATP-binding subunit ClpA